MSRLEELIAELCPDGVEYKKLGEIAIDIYRGSGIKREQITPTGTPVFVMEKSILHMGYGLISAFHTLMPLQSATPNILSMGIFCL